MTTSNHMRPFLEAQKYHRSMVAMIEAAKKTGILPEPSYEEIWNAITTTSFHSAGSFEAEIDAQMPVDVIPIVRADSEVAAVFAFCAMVAGWIKNSTAPHKAAAFGWKIFEERRKQAAILNNGFGMDRFAGGSEDPSWECAVLLNGQPDVKVVEEIARMAGRMMTVLGNARTTPSGDPEDVDGTTVGGDLERLVTDEVMQLANPQTTDMAAIRILEDRAVEYEMTGAQKQQVGPLVICIDESGSMQDGGGANRNTWAKAAALALTRVAHGENRMVAIVHFASSVVVKRLVPGDCKAMLEMTRHFLGGGTAIAEALAVGAAEVERLRQEGHIGADIVLITDGEDGNEQKIDNTLAIAQANGVRLWSVAIECRFNPNSPLVKRAMKVIRVGATKDADDVADLRDAALGQTHSHGTSGGEQMQEWEENMVKGLLN